MKAIEHGRLPNKIWGFMREHQITARSIGFACGHKTHAVTCNTIAGRQHNRKVLRFLIKAGCPKKYMGLPKDMRTT